MPGKEKKAPVKVASKAAAPYTKAAQKSGSTAAKTEAKKKQAPTTPSLFHAEPKNFGIGQDVPYRRDISRFMRWPAFVTRQRKTRVLQRRLKVPPALNQFRKVLDRTTRNEVLNLIKKYAPETRKEKRDRQKAYAAKVAENPAKADASLAKRPVSVITGLQEVTRAIENNKAKLVIVACNVDPIELVLWIPALCRNNKIPYAIIKDKARLGDAIHQKTAAVVAVTEVRSEDEGALKNIVRSVNARFLSRSDVIRRQWGGNQQSLRSVAAARKKRARQQVGAKAATA